MSSPLTEGLYTYEWDAENRLKAMQTNAIQIWSGVNRRRYEHYYDYLNRRVRTDTLAAVGSSWFAIRYSTFFYEGWNMIREKIYDADQGVTDYRTYAWGLDIVGSLSSSGGVQGLIAMRDSHKAKTYLPGYDANGNVAVMFDAADGSIETAYEYSPFGEYLRKEGDYADENPIRFSTKYTDDETNLVYCGRRYYDPKDGRFVGLDPLEEAGGINLYAFVTNNAANRWDYLGMTPLSDFYADGVWDDTDTVDGGTMDPVNVDGKKWDPPTVHIDEFEGVTTYPNLLGNINPSALDEVISNPPQIFVPNPCPDIMGATRGGHVVTL